MKLKKIKLKKDFLLRYYFNTFENFILSKSALLHNQILPLSIRSFLYNKNNKENIIIKNEKELIKNKKKEQNKVIKRKNITWEDYKKLEKNYYKHTTHFHPFYNICEGKKVLEDNNNFYLENSSFFFSSRIRNFCLISGRSRGILSKFGISRLMFRKLVDNGYISGYRYK